MQETRVRSLGREDPLEEKMATHSSILAWKTPISGGAWRAPVWGVAHSRTRLSKHAVVVQWIGIGAVTVRAWIHSLVREPRSHKSRSVTKNKKCFLNSSQWLRLHAPNAGGTGSFPGWGIKISHAARFSLKKKFFFKHESNTTLLCASLLFQSL